MLISEMKWASLFGNWFWSYKACFSKKWYLILLSLQRSINKYIGQSLSLLLLETFVEWNLNFIFIHYGLVMSYSSIDLVDYWFRVPSLIVISHSLRPCLFIHRKQAKMMLSLIARFMGPIWGPSGADRTQVGPVVAPWILLSGVLACWHKSIADSS